MAKFGVCTGMSRGAPEPQPVPVERLDQGAIARQVSINGVLARETIPTKGLHTSSVPDPTDSKTAPPDRS